ncbi:hypothetical protein ILP92_03930 [Maribius pontilimi]|uniref:Uncharacterized protein n=1 Tax=Palleronia pontilimi TaxID=1964209 RepID=A0A934MD24_9RHOB|nr:hypothetical protein [Palleronia pontilimi]MBJ3761896.1 hypothetical protein [Palleronia pontilimi]
MHMNPSGTVHTPSAFPTVEELFTFQSSLSHHWFDNILFFFADNTQVERNEYDYKADDGTLTLKVSIKLEDLVGKDTGSSFAGFDTTLIEGLVADLGATDMSFTKFVVKDDEIVFELVANGITATEAQVAAQLEVLPMGLTIEDADGDTAEIALHMGAEDAPIHALAETDLDAMMESYADYLSAANKAQIEEVLGDYGPTECAAIVDSFHDYDPDRDIPDQLMMTEDVWFGVAPGQETMHSARTTKSSPRWNGTTAAAATS